MMVAPSGRWKDAGFSWVREVRFALKAKRFQEPYIFNGLHGAGGSLAGLGFVRQ
jgi:hypothetical protein